MGGRYSSVSQDTSLRRAIARLITVHLRLAIVKGKTHHIGTVFDNASGIRYLSDVPYD